METSWQGAAPGGSAVRADGRAELALDPEAAGKGREFRAFGKDGFTFFDFLDIINPLQHIPVVSTLYRNITGDEIDPGARIAGATLFGGPVGLAVSALDTMIEHGTGKDVGDHVLAFLQDDDAPQKTQVAAAAMAPEPVQIALAPPEDYARREEKARMEPAAAPAVSDAAGMTAIPIAKATFASPKYTSRAAPDLQLLRDAKASSPSAGPQSAEPEPARRVNKAAPAERPAPLKAESLALFETGAGPQALTPRSAPPRAKVPTNLLPEGGNGWVYEAMLQAMDKYENTSRLAKQPSPPGLSVSR